MQKLDFKIYNATTEIPVEWNLMQNDDLFLKTQFLKALECSCPKNITPFYIGVFKAHKLVGIAILQRVQMYLDDAFRNNNGEKGGIQEYRNVGI